MKRILTLLIFILPVIAGAQGVDSSKMYIKNISFQARDLELLTSKVLRGPEIYEDFYDIAKTKFRVGNPPANTQSVTIDSIRVEALIELSQWMRNSDYGRIAVIFSRVDAVIKALPNTYLQRIISDMDAGYMQIIINERGEGRRLLRGIRQ